MIDGLLLKLVALATAQQALGVVRLHVTRYIIRDWFSHGEMNMLTWFSLRFLLSLSPLQILGLAIIASFTAVTFPLGIWIGSFKLGLSWPISYAVNMVVLAAMTPWDVLIAKNALKELVLNQTTIAGIAIVIVASIATAVGFYLMYAGNA